MEQIRYKGPAILKNKNSFAKDTLFSRFLHDIGHEEMVQGKCRVKFYIL